MAIDFGNYASNYGGIDSTAVDSMAKGIKEGLSKLPTKADKLARFDNEFFQGQFSGLAGKFDLGTGAYSSIEKNPNYRRGFAGKGNFQFEPKMIDGQKNPKYKGPFTKKVDANGMPLRHSPFKTLNGFNFKPKHEMLEEYLGGLRKKYGPLFAKKMGDPLVFSNTYDKFKLMAAEKLKNQILTLKSSSPTWTNKKLYDAINSANNPGMMQFMKENRMFEDAELAPILGPHSYWGDPETSMFGEFNYGKGLMPTGIPGISGDPNKLMSDVIKWGVIGGGAYMGWKWYADKNNPNMGTATSPDGTQTKKMPRPKQLGGPGHQGPKQLPPAQKQLPPVPKQVEKGWTRPSGPPGQFTGRVGTPPIARTYPGNVAQVDEFGNFQKTPKRPTSTKPMSVNFPGADKPGEGFKTPTPRNNWIPHANKIIYKDSFQKQQDLKLSNKDLKFNGKIIPKNQLVNVGIDSRGNMVKVNPNMKIPNNVKIINVPPQALKGWAAWKQFGKENLATVRGWKNLIKGGLQYTAAGYAGNVAGTNIARQMGSTQADKWGQVGQQAGQTGMDVYFTNKMIKSATGQNVFKVTKQAVNASKNSLPKLATAFGKMYKDKGSMWILKKALTKAPMVAARLGLKGLVGAAGSPSGVITAIMAGWAVADAYQLVQALTEAYESEGGYKDRSPKAKPKLKDYKFGSGEFMEDKKAWKEDPYDYKTVNRNAPKKSAWDEYFDVDFPGK